MKIEDIRVYRGRNIYSHKTVIKLILDLEDYYDVPTYKIEGFNQKLLEFMPGLHEHFCSRGYKGGFVERLMEGTYLAHVAEHIILELQNMLGYEVGFGRAFELTERIYEVIFEYKLEECGIKCARMAVDLINALIRNEDYPFVKKLEEIKKLIADLELGPSTLAIAEEARKRGIPVTRVGRGIFLRLGYGKYQKVIEGTISENTSCIAVDISCDKILTKEILRDLGIPVPEGDVAYSEEDAVAVAKSIGYPVAIKPYNGCQGKGVSLNLKSDEEVRVAYRVAKGFSDIVMVEKYIKGKHYRVLVVGDRVAAVSERIPAYVTGDGIHSIRELIDIENKNEKRGEGHEKPLTKIKIDPIMIMFLKRNNLTLDSVPRKGEVVFLRENGNLSTGGIAVDCTDEIHPDNIELAVRAAKAVGLDIAGIDITTPNISLPVEKTGGAIIEVNASPGIRMHLFPSEGKPRNVAKDIVDMLFKEGEKGTIPIVSVTGTNGKTTTTRMIAHILKLSGLVVGMTTTDGIFIDDKCVLKGDMTGPQSARTLLADRTIEAAVLETARGGIIRAGLGYDLSDVGVITNITGDHLGIDGINTLDELAMVKSLIVEAVREEGYAVLNADDPVTVGISARVRSKIIYFSKNESNIIVKKHLQKGGIAVVLKDSNIVIFEGDRMIPVADVKDIPATINGKVEHNIENALAATGAAYGLKIPVKFIAKGLTTFYCDEKHNPGRFNIFNVGNFRVVVDYGHNVDGYRKVIEALKKLDGERLIGVIGVPGDRRDEDIIKVGEISAKGFDMVYVKEDMDKRGRKIGEVARLLEKGLMIGGMPREKIKIVLSETEALKYAMEEAKPGDIVTVFYEKFEPVMKVINQYSKTRDSFVSMVEKA